MARDRKDKKCTEKSAKMESSTSDAATTAAQSSSQSPGPRKFSCLMCQQRKVKCDRQYPCSACERSRSSCIYRAPPPPRRRKGRRDANSAGASDDNLLARLKRYEELLKGLGVRLDDAGGNLDSAARNIQNDSNTYPSRDPASQKLDESQELNPDKLGGWSAKLVFGGGKSRLFENHMWASLSDEFQDSKEVLQSSSEDEDDDTPYGMPDLDGASLIFGYPSPNLNLRSLHPSPVQIFKFWQIFLDNFNPLVKILHIPTLQPLILEAASNLENISKGMETLLFAIYSSAITTMSNEECENIAGEPKSIILSRYHAATKMALINAGFLKSSDMLLLKAYVIFLLSIRDVHDPRSLWALTGIAVRIGQRLGLHRDGETMDLSVFETEMRRRLWWQIIVLDTRTAELSGAGVSVLAHLWDTKIPLNINDSDLYPQMKEFPVEHSGPTEMMFCRLRYEMGEFFRRSKTVSVIGGSWHSLSDPLVSVAEKERAVEEIEKVLEDKFLKYCDPAIPLHLLSSIVARAALCKMRVLAHYPRKSSGGEGSMTARDINLLFTNSLKTIEYDNLAQSSKSLRGYMWHVDVHFQWIAFVYLLSQLQYRTTGEEADRAWQQVGETFHNRKDLLTNSKSSLHAAIRNLTIRAWKARVAASGGATRFDGQENQPEFITMLYTACGPAIGGGPTVAAADTTHNPRNQVPPFFGHPEYDTSLETQTPQQNNLPALSGYTGGLMLDVPNPDDITSFPNNFSPMDWAQWDDLIRNHEL